MNRPLTENEITTDNVKVLAMFIYKPLVSFVKHYLDLNMEDYLKIHCAQDNPTHMAYARELDGHKYDAVVSTSFEKSLFNHDILSAINEKECQHIFVCFISNAIASIKFLLKQICIREGLDYSNLSERLVVDDNINIYLKDSEQPLYLNINIFNGNDQAKVMLLKKQ